jgi:hypothetical protein
MKSYKEKIKEFIHGLVYDENETTSVSLNPLGQAGFEFALNPK